MLAHTRVLRYVKGLLAVVFVSICWILEAEFLQGLQEPTSKDYYDKVSLFNSITKDKINKIKI